MKGTVIAKLNDLRMSPRKVRLVTDLICGSKISVAMAQLFNSKKEAARPVMKLLLSAVANAKHNFEMKEEDLKIKNITVNEGPVLHRWMPRAMGRATPIRKRSSHIQIVLEGEMPEEKTKKDSTKESKDKKDKVEKKAVVKKVAKKKTETKKVTE